MNLTMMRRWRTLVALGALLSVASLTPAQAQLGFGFAAGLNFENLSDVEVGNTETTFDNATGYHIGAFVDFSLGPVGVRPGIFYRDAGEIDVSLGNLGADAFELSMIEIPVDLRFRLGMTPLVKPYLMAGPVFSLPQTSTDAFEDNLESFNVSANLGVGVEVNLAGLTLMPELRYAFGVSRFLSDELEVNGVTFQSDDTARLNTVMLRLGIVL